MSLYLQSGYLDFDFIEKEAARINAAFIVIVGKRQVGKTYGCLKLMLDRHKKFVLMRRTQTEADMLTSGIINPFVNLGETDIEIKRDTKYTGAIYRGESFTGLTMALSTVSKVRGFSGSQYTDVVYDECIPETHVQKIKNEGDAFLNAVVTISGNREIDGKPPLKCWLLANSNDISAPILSALNITEKLEDMILRGQEYSIMPDRGIIIILPSSEKISERRKKTSIIKAIGNDNKFVEMAFENKFSYNDSESIYRQNLKEYIPHVSLVGVFTVYAHKSQNKLYVTTYKRGAKYEYSNTERGISEMVRNHSSLKPMYVHKLVLFSSLTVKERFREAIKM